MDDFSDFTFEGFTYCPGAKADFTENFSFSFNQITGWSQMLERCTRTVKEEKEKTWPGLHEWAVGVTSQTLDCFFSSFGLLSPKLDQLSKGRLKFFAEERCTYLEEIRNSDPRKRFSWLFEVEWRLDLDGQDFYQQKSSTRILSSGKHQPRPKVSVRPPTEVNLDWIIANKVFCVDTTDIRYLTPRRNPSIQDSLENLERLRKFVRDIYEYFMFDLFLLERDHSFDLNILSLSDSILDYGVFTHNIDRIKKIFPSQPKGSLISSESISLLLASLRVMEAIHYHAARIEHIEVLLHRALVTALGKEVTPRDFQECVAFHLREHLSSFLFSVRFPDKSPEGAVSITDGDGDLIRTISRRISPRIVSLQLDASTKVSLRSECYLHGWILHQFSDTKNEDFVVRARARKFSRFLLLLGRVTSGNTFSPISALIVQDGESVNVPLDLETIPSGGDFRRAVATMSSEQQSFSRAIRSMQVSQTLFAILTIPIKPQMERVLQLPSLALSKEVMLTEGM